jgi:hypothetical protein
MIEALPPSRDQGRSLLNCSKSYEQHRFLRATSLKVSAAALAAGTRSRSFAGVVRTHTTLAMHPKASIAPATISAVCAPPRNRSASPATNEPNTPTPITPPAWRAACSAPEAMPARSRAV